jgi:seryl-tRNA synthetase
MHDIRFIRDNPAAFDAGLSRRGMSGPTAEDFARFLNEPLGRTTTLTEDHAPTSTWTFSQLILLIDRRRRGAIEQLETALRDRRVLSEEAGQARKAGNDERFQEIQDEVANLKEKIEREQEEVAYFESGLRDFLARIPNLPLDEVPEGPDETANVEVRRWGIPRALGFKPLEHFEIPAARGGLDFPTATKLSGSRFVVLRGAVARVHRALAQFMLDLHTTEHGLAETWTPVLVKEEAMFGTNQLPKFAEDSYQTTNGWWLIPTSEVSLTNSVAGDILDEGTLPIRLTAHSQCFRSEAGSAGKDTTGMLRQHQFEKVEMVTICTPETALDEHERMTKCAEAVLERLGLPYRTIVLCTGDMGFGAQKTHDLEVWLPGQNTYREISSVSTCGQFQARRMNARYRPAGGKPEFVATLNGSGLAVGRCLIAVLENGQEVDGSVTLPAALVTYLQGKTRISTEGQLV